MMLASTLRCDYMLDPVGFDFDRPTLSWLPEDQGLDKEQSAYQLIVCTDPDGQAVFFDSGKAPSSVSIGTRLEIPLAPCTGYWWRVRLWDEADQEGPWSEAAYFETGRYDRPWRARWITPAFSSKDLHPMLRRPFAARGPVRSARIYACGLGLYELYLNGRRIGDERLTPYCNAYDKWLQYQTYDVTDQLIGGDNLIGAWLGNGWYKGRMGWTRAQDRKAIYGDAFALLLELEIEYQDGTSQIIATDEDWRAAPSPVQLSDIYDGETYDARLEQPGWDQPAFDASAWVGVKPIDIGYDRLMARKSPPVRVTQEIPAKSVFRAPNGDVIADFGQNMAGWVKLRVEAPPGTAILFTHAEVLDREGNFYNANMRTALVRQLYIAKGQGVETYAPHFTFFGFRYIKIEGWPGVIPDPADLIAQVVHTDLESTGTFTCSDDRINRLYQNTVWGQRSNFLDVPTDCPQRDERMGWTGDAQVFAATASMHMQTDAFFRKFLYDLAQEQKDLGFVPVVVPYVLRRSGEWQNTTAAWGDAATIIPWTLYLLYGDKALLEAQYGSMKAWVEYIRSCDVEQKDLFYGKNHLGDWLAQDTNKPDGVYGATPTDYIASAYYVCSARLLSKAAAVLGKEEDASLYAGLSERVRQSLLREFVSPNGRIVSETQTAQAVALYMDLLPEAFRQKAADKLAERVIWEDYHLTTGFVGTPYLCPALSANGYNHIAYRLLLQTTYPSWLYTVGKGATTMWERWNSIKEDGTMGEVGMNSFNHYAYGSISEWLYRVVAGINPLEEAPGYHRARIAPMPNAQLTHARATLDTVSGRYESGWALADGLLTVEIAIPCNAHATIVLPDARGAAITENGRQIEANAPFERGSGRYLYQYKPNGETIYRA